LLNITVRRRLPDIFRTVKAIGLKLGAW